jgi:hypothetical protein
VITDLSGIESLSFHHLTLHCHLTQLRRRALNHVALFHLFQRCCPQIFTQQQGPDVGWFDLGECHPRRQERKENGGAFEAMTTKGG